MARTAAACRAAASQRGCSSGTAENICSASIRTTGNGNRIASSGREVDLDLAIYRASHDDYDTSVLPSGYPAGTPQEAGDCACGLYLGDTTAWLNPPPPTN